MRKSFTWFLSLMVLLIAFATHGNAQEAQETVELYAEEASDCYNEADDYTVTISVRDFIQLTEFDLDLEYNDAVFAYDAVSGIHTSLASVVVTESAGVITLAWDDAAVTIGDNVKTDILVLHFTLLGYPGNVAESFSSDMEWTTTDFWYTLPDSSKDPVNTVVSEDGALAVDVSLTDIETEFTAESCAGGDVTVTVTAPEADMYLFNEDPNPALWVWTSSPSFLAAAGETVTIRVKDTNGCMSLVTSVVLPTTVEPVAFTVESHDPACYGAKGSVVISATGGTAPYSYWIADDDGSGTAHDPATVAEKGNFQFSQEPGDYWVNVQDANDCADFDNTWTAISITDNNVVIAGTVAITNVLCNDGDDGELVVTVTEGGAAATDDYQISIDGGATYGALNVFTFEDLIAGDYDVVAKNSNGCVVTIDDAVTITEPTAITFDMAIVDVACGGLTDGEIAVTNIVGGTTDYTLEIEEDGTVTTEAGVTGAGFTFTGLMPTYYSLTITDANGCEVEYDNPNGTGNTIAVQSPDDIQFDVDITDPLCNDEDASVAISNVTGGTGSYIYSFDGGTTWVDTMTVDSWPSAYAGMTISVANADSTCDVSQTIDDTDVVNPGVLAAITTELLAPTCIDGNDGNIALEITGGTEPYYYSINGSSWKEAEEFTNIKVGVGIHTIMVKDANDCATTDIVETVTLEANEVTAVSDSNIDCFGLKTGTISVDVDDWAEGVTSNYPSVRDLTFYVENEAGVVAAFEPSNQGGTETYFSAGIYVVWAVDNYTCDSNKDSVWVTENAELKITEVIANGASCFGSFEGIVTVHATGGNDPVLEYAVVNNEGALGNIADDKWLPFDTYDNTVTPPLSTVSFQVDAGTYWIAVRDDGCDEVTYGPIVVEGYTELLVDEDEITSEESLCYLDSMATITVPMDAVTGGAGSYLFTLLVDDGGWVEVEGKVDQVTGEFTNLPAGSYAVLVEDAEDCPSYTTVDPIVITDPVEVTFTTDIMHMSCWDSNDGRITVNAAGGSGDYWYAINNTNTWIAFEEGVTSKTYIVTETGTFVVWVKDENDCVATSDTVIINAPEQLGADITVDNDVTCVGDTDGQITVVGTGGWAGVTSFEFAVNSGAWTNATTFAALPAGDHTLYVRDVFAYAGEYQALDCIDSVDFTITVPDSISYDVVIANVKCKDGADGSLTVNVIGGGTPSLVDGYTVQLTGDAYDETFVTGLDYSIVFEDLAHSHYTVYITDSLGCELAPTIGDNDSPYVTIESWEVAEPAEYLTLDPEWLNDVTCYDGEDGSFALVATGGTEPYKYYAGLSIEPSGHVLVPEPPAADSDEWLDTDTLMVGAGTWVTWVLDANGCMVGGEYDMGVAVNKWRVKVEQPDMLVWEFDSIGVAPDRVVDYVMPSCYGEWDGVLQLVDIAGGSGTYNAHVTGMSLDSMAVDTMYTDITMTAGVYLLGGVPASVPSGLSVTVTDDNGCTSVSRMVVVDQPDMLEVVLVPGADAFTCADAIEGLIEANVVGGTEITGETEKYWYQLLKNGVILTPWQADGSAFIVEVGNTFIIQVRDANGCTTQDTIVIDPIAPVLISSIDNISCFADEKASATVNATGEMGRMLQVKYRIYEETTTYTVHPELFETSVDLVQVLEFDAENIDDKHYEFIVTDDMGCESTPDTLTFDYVQTELVYTAELSNVTECTQDVTISVGGGTAPYVVMVNDSVLVDMTYTMERGSYVVKVMDSHMCSKEETIVVEGAYVVRDTTIDTYIDETTAFVDVESGVDTMLAVGTHQFVYTLACERTLNVTVVEIPRPYAIVDIQGDGDVSPIEGKIAEVTATVTAISAGEGFFVQDANAANSALWVEYSAVNDLGLTVGDGVVVVGAVAEIANVTSIEATSVTAATGTPAIAAMELAPTAAQDEMYESMLVAVMGGRATAADESGAWTVYYEVADDITVNDWLYSSTAVEGEFYDVTGIVNARLDNFRLEPRMESDVTAVPTGIEGFDAVEFSVYPNPFNDVINLVNHEKLTRVVISNIAGQRVIDVVYPNSEIRTNSLVSGIYVVSMFTENGIAKTEKIIKK